MAKLAYKMEKEDLETESKKPNVIDNDVLVELEKEKLKVLKEIRDKLPAKRKIPSKHRN